ncbi:hypothetical protein [Arsenophonus nasoniae]|uniref:hypothetical protein n=1 Tax=Arsenophonus nasoniae TaxID=638 RepID=UPI00387A0261
MTVFLFCNCDIPLPRLFTRYARSQTGGERWDFNKKDFFELINPETLHYPVTQKRFRESTERID